MEIDNIASITEHGQSPFGIICERYKDNLHTVLSMELHKSFSGIFFNLIQTAIADDNYRLTS